VCYDSLIYCEAVQHMCEKLGYEYGLGLVCEILNNHILTWTHDMEGGLLKYNGFYTWGCLQNGTVPIQLVRHICAK
jgi:hypothetical protein